MGLTTWRRAVARSRAPRRRRARVAGMEQLEPRILLALDPTGLEQELFQLVNRFRADPQGELARLLSSTHPPTSADALIQSQLEYWGVRGDALRSQWANLAPVAPLAWSESLYTAAQAHNQAMFRDDSQQHQLPGELDPGGRLQAAGYDWERWGENIYAFPRSVAEAHAGFVINWGPGQSGIQSPPSHRLRLLRDEYVHLGVAISPVGTSPNRSVGPLLVTQDFATPREATSAYVVGAVFTSSSGSLSYEAGSGYGAVQIVFEGLAGTFATTSFSAGGYQLQLPPGTYRVRAQGGTLPAPLVKDGIVVGDRNVAVDLVYPANRGWIPRATDDVYVVASGSLATLPVLDNDRDPAGVPRHVSVSIVAGPAVGQIQIDPATGRVDYQPDGIWVGVDTFRYRVQDDDGFTSNEAVVRVVVVDPLDRPWRNPDNVMDVNVDSQVTPADALQIVNALVAGQGGPLPVPPAAARRAPPLRDVNGDNILSPRDALLVINFLNRRAAAEGEEAVWAVNAAARPAAAPPTTLGQVAAADTPSPRPAPRDGWPVVDPPRGHSAPDERLGPWPLAPGQPPAVARALDERRTPWSRVRPGSRRAPNDAEADLARDACFGDWPWLEPWARITW